MGYRDEGRGNKKAERNVFTIILISKYIASQEFWHRDRQPPVFWVGDYWCGILGRMIWRSQSGPTPAMPNAIQKLKGNSTSDRCLHPRLRSYGERQWIPKWWLVWYQSPEWSKLKEAVFKGLLLLRVFLKRLPGVLSEMFFSLSSDAFLSISLFLFGVTFKGLVCLHTTWISFRFVSSRAASVSDSVWTDCLWMGW